MLIQQNFTLQLRLQASALIENALIENDTDLFTSLESTAYR